MNLPVILEKHRLEIDHELKNIINSRTGPLYDMMRYHFGWIDKDNNPVANNSGKALRPSLCLFCCEAAGGNYSAILPAAAALELVHNFSLIHDDIQDNDRERRHRATVWAVYGKAQAINAGTAMRILANNAIERLRDTVSCARLAHINVLLDEVSLKLIEGQYLDISFEDRFDVTVADYMTMISGKTAALISGSMELGAYMGTRRRYAGAFREIGRDLGLAFQIRDDILGIWGDEKETGKSSGNDIRRRKKSFPVVYALEQSEPVLKKELISIYQNGEMDDAKVKRVLEIFDSAATRKNAQARVDQYCLAALRSFDSLKLAVRFKREMAELVEFLTGRNY